MVKSVLWSKRQKSWKSWSELCIHLRQDFGPSNVIDSPLQGKELLTHWCARTLALLWKRHSLGRLFLQRSMTLQYYGYTLATVLQTQSLWGNMLSSQILWEVNLCSKQTCPGAIWEMFLLWDSACSENQWATSEKDHFASFKLPSIWLSPISSKSSTPGTMSLLETHTCECLFILFTAFSRQEWSGLHSLLEWTTFCQNSPPWPIHLGWPYMAWVIVSLS